MSLLHPDYINILNALKEKIKQARTKAAITVNVGLLKLYWEIGMIVSAQEKTKGWGAKVVVQLSKDLSSEFSDMKGFSQRNLRYMRDFALAYPELGITDTQSILQQAAAKSPSNETTLILQGMPAKFQIPDNQYITILQESLAKLSWYHHTTLLDKVKDREIRLFYIQETIQNGWSRDVMVHQIEGGLHQRQGKIASNFKNTIAAEQSELVQQLFKDPYKFEFIYLGKEAKERDLEDALINQLTKFLLELGQHFAFMGRQYKVMVGEREYFFDLLFYHTRLKRYIVIDLKIDEFKPEYKGKMEFYLNLADEHLKQKDDEKSIGLILCKTKDGLVVEYALRDSSKPIGIAEYKINELLPANIRGELPSIEELEAEIEKEMEELKKPVDKKYDRLKELISGIKQPKVKEKRSPKTSQRVFTKVVLPLRDEIKKALAKISKEFSGNEIMVWTDNQGHRTDAEAQAHVKKHKEFNEYRIEIRLRGFKPAGTKAFDIWKDLCITTGNYNYAIGLGRNQQQNILPEKLYHELPDKKEFEKVVEKITESIIDDITQQIERIKQEKK